MKSTFPTRVLRAAAALSICLAAHASETGQATGTVNVQVPMAPQPWQVRRAQFAKLVEGVRTGNAVALKQFDDVLTQFDTKPFERTPVENMEILGVYYVPREGAAKTLSIVVMNATLGWYDALRFGSTTGKVEIAQQLFKLPYIVAGPAATTQAMNLIEGSPEVTEPRVAQGIAFARANRGKVRYDEHWPTAYGMERYICVQQGPCEGSKALPADQWDAAWQEAEKRVRTYFHTSKSAPAVQ